MRGKNKVRGTNLVRKANTKENKTTDLERIVGYTALWNEEGVEAFLEEASMPIGATTQETVKNAIVVIAVGKKAGKLEEFLELHPDKDLFSPDEQAGKKAIEKLTGKSTKPNPTYWSKSWVKMMSLLAFLLLVFVLVYVFVKEK